eukprot:gene5892-40826_t
MPTAGGLMAARAAPPRPPSGRRVGFPAERYAAVVLQLRGKPDYKVLKEEEAARLTIARARAAAHIDDAPRRASAPALFDVEGVEGSAALMRRRRCAPSVAELRVLRVDRH